MRENALELDVRLGRLVSLGGGLFLAHGHNAVTHKVIDVLEPLVEVVLHQLEAYWVIKHINSRG
jgi:hypothetical protein